uniref:SH3 domain containing ring finger 3 n=1 Tax=Zosterops lateralis melanops TaxID=1220523 RepID=A0A8D2NQ55_ZOSLA
FEAFCLFHFSTRPGDLRFNKGDIIILRRKVDENWYHGELNGNHGFFPASYIQCIKPLPQAPPQGKALYDFEIKDKDQDKDLPGNLLLRTSESTSADQPLRFPFQRHRIGAGQVVADVMCVLSPCVTSPHSYLALYAYKPQKNDELELRKGEMYRVIEKCQDGWFKGTSLRSGMSGVFPGNYVTPVSR